MSYPGIIHDFNGLAILTLPIQLQAVELWLSQAKVLDRRRPLIYFGMKRWMCHKASIYRFLWMSNYKS